MWEDKKIERKNRNFLIKCKDFLDPKFMKFCQLEFEQIRIRRKKFKGKPDEYDRLEIQLDRIFQSFYKQILNE